MKLLRDKRSWANRRRIIYGSVFGALFVFALVNSYFTHYYKSPTCFDGKENGSETGRDCGGDCVRICAFEVLPPKLIWVNSFKIAPGQYNAVAYVENPNQFAGSPEINYTITLKNGDRTVAERKGKSILPPNSMYPFFEGRIFTEDKSDITETLISIESPEIWQPAGIGAEQFKTRDIVLSNADNRPRLDVELENVTLNDVKDIEIVATIFNADGFPATASQTIIDSFSGKSVEDIVFTWQAPIAKTVRNCVIPTDVALVIDLSGSMNNDNDDPPQPLTDALTAASTFAGKLDKKDQLSLITFATNATVNDTLTSQHSGVASNILNLFIPPEEEAGFTNTFEALKLAADELNSERHNEDARRVMIVLTDGLPTDDDDERPIVEETETLARNLDQSGIEIYAIGLGEGVDQGFIGNLASSEDSTYFALNSSDLNSIYNTITGDICEVGPTKIDVIAKTTTNFTPLR